MRTPRVLAKGRRNDNPEERLQRSVARFFDEHLPGDILWTATALSGWLPPQTRVRLREAGLRPGFPDLAFAIPHLGLRVIELKIDDAPSSLSPDQKRWRDVLQPLGYWARCKSVEEVVGTLQGWGVILIPSPVWRPAP